VSHTKLDPLIAVQLPFSIWQRIYRQLQLGCHVEVDGLLNAIAAQVMPAAEAACRAANEQAAADQAVANLAAAEAVGTTQ